MACIHDLVKNQDTYRADTRQTVLEVAHAMVERNIGAVPVLRDGCLVGVFSERDLMRRQLGARISCALEKLTPRERMVFELKHYHGLKLRTVGEILHTTEETAKNTLFRATQKLRGALADMR